MVDEYRAPEVVDYGGLVEMTESVHLMLGAAATNDLSFSSPSHSTMGGGGGGLPVGNVASGASSPGIVAGPNATHGHLADTGGGPDAGTLAVGGVGAGPGGSGSGGGGAGGGGGGGGGELPFTGFVAGAAALVGTGLAASGAALRRAVGRRRAS